MASKENHNLLVTVPHAGERVPDAAHWLHGLPEPTLMRDVDRFVDQIYKNVVEALELPYLDTPWHRYVVDLNRFESDFDQQSVKGAAEPKGTHPKGLHWSITTHGEVLISDPMSAELHESFVSQYYTPFHEKVRSLRSQLQDGVKGDVFHLDAHSMPSVGTVLHADPGQRRSDIVISDYHGTTCSADFRDLVIGAYQDAGFEVAYNYPYVGGGITRMLGAPADGFHNIQVEINRDLYMDEDTKKKKPKDFEDLCQKVQGAVQVIYRSLKGRV